MAAAQVVDGHKVMVIGLWPGQLAPEKYAQILRESGVGYAIVHSGHPFLRPLAIPRLRRLLARHNPNVVHSHLPAASIATAWWHRTVSRRRRGQLVATIHGWERRQSLGWRRRLFSWGLKQHDEVIVVSHWLARQTADFGLEPGAVHVVHHGILQPSVDPTNRSAIRKSIEDHFGSHDAQVIGSIARHTESKGLDVLIGAVPLMDPRCVVVIVGAEADATPALKALVAELGIAERCWFTGTTSDPADWMAAFDIFCLPSHLEGFGLVFLEAGFIGIPIVGTDVPATNEIIRTGVDGILVSDGDSASLATSIDCILENSALARQYVDTFRKRVETDFSFKAMVSATYEAYFKKGNAVS
jgi:glycosyltransferase involved in cell wall biosynthesis